jgi:hypothetical protein
MAGHAAVFEGNGRSVMLFSARAWAAIAGLGSIVVGSLGRWVTSPLNSGSGFSGDGRITMGLAVIAVGVLLAFGPKFALGLRGAAITALAVWEIVHIHRGVANVTVFGQQVDHAHSVPSTPSSALALPVFDHRDALVVGGDGPLAHPSFVRYVCALL